MVSQLDDKDRALLREIQGDATLSLQSLAERLAMSQSTVWRKLQDFDAAGVVTGRVALVAPAAVDLKVCVIANITLTNHSEEATATFQRLVDERLRVVAFPIREYWQDIGEHADYRQAQEYVKAWNSAA